MSGAFPAFDVEGMDIFDFARMAGESVSSARNWLRRNGYIAESRIIRRAVKAHDIEDQIRARLATVPPPFPCWRCGARVCAHRRAA